MITGTEEKVIIAYFQGGNAKEIKSSFELRQILETIKSFCLGTDQKEVEQKANEHYGR